MKFGWIVQEYNTYFIIEDARVAGLAPWKCAKPAAAAAVCIMIAVSVSDSPLGLMGEAVLATTYRAAALRQLLDGRRLRFTPKPAIMGMQFCGKGGIWYDAGDDCQYIDHPVRQPDRRYIQERPA